MREAVIVATARTGMAKSFRGSFNLTRPDDMAAHCIKAVMQKTPQLDPAEVEEVVIGTGFPEGPQGFNVGRNVAIMGGLPVTVPGATVSRFCSSGLYAVAVAAHMVQNEGADAVIGGGIESITMMQNEFNKKNLFNPWLLDHKKEIYMPMGQTAEIVAERYKVSRESQDELAFASQQRTAAFQKSGKIKDEIAPMTVTMEVTDKATGEKSTKEVIVDRDECNRPETTREGLAKLPPALQSERWDGDRRQLVAVLRRRVGQPDDVARSCESAWRRAAGLLPRVRVRGVRAGRDGDRPGVRGAEAPEAARPQDRRHRHRRIERGLRVASGVLPRSARHRPGAKLNPNGGAISIGHPYGMTGARMAGTLLLELRRQKKRWGIVTMCIGGGMGAAGLFEAAR